MYRTQSVLHSLLRGECCADFGGRTAERRVGSEQGLKDGAAVPDGDATGVNEEKRSFEASEAEGLAVLDQRCGVILDEADHGLEAFPRGIDLGYRGVSIKNCKGVFRSAINAARCAQDERLFQSAEDLTNLGALALQQDLATVALLGLPDVERNGHHYFPGLSHLSATEQRVAVGQHKDLYTPHDPLGGELRIEKGRLQLGSLHATGYGCAAVPPPGTPFGAA